MKALPVLALVLFALEAGASPLTGEAASDTTLAGVVVSSDNGAPIPGARVFLADSSASAIADATGRFRFRDLPPGEHTLIVESLGFVAKRVSVIVLQGERIDTLQIVLDPAPILLSEVVVTATGESRRRRETPASISVIGGDVVRRLSPTHPAELMNRIPGVWVSPTSTEGHFTGIRQPITTKPVYLYLEDGVPTRSPGFFNHNALYEVNVPQAGRVEVIRGPGTALYGSDAIGGVIDVSTRAPARDPEVRAVLEGSTNALYRGLLSASNTWGDDGLRLDLNVTQGGGWRDAQGYSRQSGTLRWDRTMGGGISFQTTATYSSVFQNDASNISREELETNPEVNHHPIVYRSVDALRVSSRFELRRGHSLLQVTPFFRWNTLDLMPSWMLTYDPVVYRTGHWSLGVMARYHRDIEPIGGRLTIGVDVDRSPGFREEDRISVLQEEGIFTDWQREERLYDYRATFLGASPYVQLSVQPLEGVNVTAGLRYDNVGFDYRTKLGPTQEGSHRIPASTSVWYSNLGPSVGVTWDVTRELNLFASYRESFRSPSERQLFRQGSAENTVDLKPVHAQSLEAGFRGNWETWLGWEVSVYRMEIRDDILSFIRPEDGLRESVNAGRTRHEGIEVGVSAALPQGFAAALSVTRASHRYLEWRPREDLDYAGNEIELAPRTLATARLSAPLPALPTATRRGAVELEVVRMGRFWMDPENEHAYDGHTLWNVRAEIPVTTGLALSARLMNLTDRRYAERASYNAFRGEEFAPGNPRTFLLGLQYQWNR